MNMIPPPHTEQDIGLDQWSAVPHSLEEVEGEKSPVPVWCAPRSTFHTGLNFLHAVPLPVPASEIFWLTLMAIN